MKALLEHISTMYSHTEQIPPTIGDTASPITPLDKGGKRDQHRELPPIEIDSSVHREVA